MKKRFLEGGIIMIDNKYSTMNDMQQKAVYRTNGPVLILAGAGSGKTRVLTHRISYLIEELGIKPWNILAITFTNKAAKEMKERVSDLLGEDGPDLWVSTFHSACVRILRRNIDLLGYERSFVIYDTDDQKGLIKECLKQLNIDSKNFAPNAVLANISSAKNELLTPKQFEVNAKGDYREEKIANIYDMYQKKLKSNNALDFDDIIQKTVELFRERPDVLDYYQERFKYIMVDEYQDTNTAQYKLVSLLASKYRNLCVVGDDDQSIYKFRGANIQNILNFEKDFKDTFVVRLEQNYRCTKTILEAANNVIKNNTARKVKKLWTENDEGNLLKSYNAMNESDEAKYIATTICSEIENNAKEFRDFSILYRTNAQSRVLEEMCMKQNIPYRLYGGTPFYQRKEIKDLLAYLRIIVNPSDDMAVKRVINVPRRGIGKATIDKVEMFAAQNELDFYTVLYEANEVPSLARVAKKLQTFANLIAVLKVEMETMSVVEFVENVIEKISYREYINKQFPEDSDSRNENIDELISKVAEYEQRVDEPSLRELLEEVALVAAVDTYEEDANVITLMTLHSAKGLEFPVVFIAGMEEGVFPSYMSIISGNEDDIEEERRLCYVGITRGKKELYLTNAKSRMVRGVTQYHRSSRFMEEIPSGLFDESVTPKERVGKFVNKVEYANNNDFKNRFIKAKNKVNENIPKPSKNINIEVGDLVKHKKFGVGTVKAIQPGGADYQVTIMFTKVGLKKLFLNLSGIVKI